MLLAAKMYVESTSPPPQTSSKKTTSKQISPVNYLARLPFREDHLTAITSSLERFSAPAKCRALHALANPVNLTPEVVTALSNNPLTSSLLASALPTFAYAGQTQDIEKRSETHLVHVKVAPYLLFFPALLSLELSESPEFVLVLEPVLDPSVGGTVTGERERLLRDIGESALAASISNAYGTNVGVTSTSGIVRTMEPRELFSELPHLLAHSKVQQDRIPSKSPIILCHASPGLSSGPGQLESAALPRCCLKTLEDLVSDLSPLPVFNRKTKMGGTLESLWGNASGTPVLSTDTHEEAKEQGVDYKATVDLVEPILGARVLDSTPPSTRIVYLFVASSLSVPTLYKMATGNQFEGQMPRRISNAIAQEGLVFVRGQTVVVVPPQHTSSDPTPSPTSTKNWLNGLYLRANSYSSKSAFD